ncbi:MAG: Fic family protein [Candidatus Blackburnbacteria bacterium]|nr:Fic family protein [Candidatus Blackburnbacteria bacterium]
METLSFTFSGALRNSLQKIDGFRSQILLSPIPPRVELRLRWEATLNRIYWSLALAGDPLPKAEIIKLLTAEKKRPTQAEQEVLAYKKALDYISQEWLVSPRRVTMQTVIDLYNISSRQTVGKHARLSYADENSIKHLLEYLQTGSDHPIIQAGIAQACLINIRPFFDGNGRVARLLGLLFLYKYGYDIQGFLVLSDYWRKDSKGLEYATERSLKTKNFTVWLEYFAHGILVEVEKIAQNLKSPVFQTDLPATFWRLNDRQKEILVILEEPEATITNKKMQKHFKVSQITASRDLAKLASLGLLFAHGRGRATYYTRA